MRKLFTTLALIVFSSAVFISCEEEGINEALLDPTKVGESIFRVKFNDTLVIRKNVEGIISPTGEFSMDIDLRKFYEEEDDVVIEYQETLNISTLSFEKGTFPAVNNIATYANPHLDMIGLTVNSNNPDYSTGWIKISKINKVAKVIEGSFKFTIYPMPDENLNFPPSFEMEGDFVNLRYDRAVEEYFDALVGDKDFKANTQSVSINKGKTEVTAVNAVTKEKLVFRFDQELPKGSYATPVFEAEYHSPNGVVYFSEESLGGNLRIAVNNSQFVEGGFSFKLKSDSGKQVEINDGEFRLRY